MQEKYYPPPPQTTPTFDMLEIKNQNKGLEDYIGYGFQLSLSTIWRNHLHLTSKWRGTFQYIFFNVENSIKRELRKKKL